MHNNHFVEYIADSKLEKETGSYIFIPCFCTVHIQQAMLQVGLGHGVRIAQCQHVKMTTTKCIPVQVDGGKCRTNTCSQSVYSTVSPCACAVLLWDTSCPVDTCTYCVNIHVHVAINTDG